MPKPKLLAFFEKFIIEMRVYLLKCQCTKKNEVFHEKASSVNVT